jgi:hypothetical protein
MAQLTYSAIASLDGYVEDQRGHFDWAAPDEDVFSLINELERPVGTYLYGRRMYETMVYWERAHLAPGQSKVELDFSEIWQSGRESRLLPHTRVGLERQDAARARFRRRGGPGPEAELRARYKRGWGKPGGPSAQGRARR